MDRSRSIPHPRLVLVTSYVRIVRHAIAAVALAMACYHLWVAFVGPPNALVLRSVHVGFALTLAFLTLPLTRQGEHEHPRPWDLALIVVALAASAYPVFFLDYLMTRIYYVDDPTIVDLVLGWAMVVLVLEATRRSVGLALPLTAAAFIVYALTFGGQGWLILIDQLYLTTEGIFGIPAGVSASYVILFIIFGALVERSGTGKLFMDFALALTGHQVGGPAKVACVTSGLFGTVSGSAVANVMTTGTFTIPLMRRIGYRPAFAGAVEAVASTGGVVMPPVMGMVAFMMAEFLDVPYLEVALAAAIPAALYYFSLYMLVDLEARRNDLGGLPASSLPSVWETLRGGWFYVIPIAVLVYTLAFSRMPAGIAAAYGLGALLIVSSFNPETRFTFPRLLHGFQASARNSVVIAVICGSVGILVASVVITGATLRMGVLLVEAAGDRLFPLLLMAGVGSLVLGTGVPSIASYTLLAVTVAPAVIELGVPAIGAHLFVVYWGVSHVFTPPVGGALYIASSFSGVDIWRQGFHAVRLGIAIFVVPFLFCYHPELLLIGTPEAILLQTLIAALAMVCVTSSFIGYIRTPLGWTTRVWLVAAAVALAVQGPVLLPAGLLLALAVMASQLVAARAAAPHDRETTWPDRPAGPEEAPLTGDRRGSPRREP